MAAVIRSSPGAAGLCAALSRTARAPSRVLAGDSAPTALIYDNDVMATAGANITAGLGLSVPGDVSIVSWEDSALCRMVHPWLTALSRDTIAFGRIAAQC